MDPSRHTAKRCVNAAAPLGAIGTTGLLRSVVQQTITQLIAGDQARRWNGASAAHAAAGVVDAAQELYGACWKRDHQRSGAGAAMPPIRHKRWAIC